MSEGTFAHRPEIDGLRAVAVLPVIWHHAGLPGLPGGFLGVDFVISGYLITGILLSDLSANRFSIGRFYERRARRILPALILMLLASLPLALWLLLPGQLVDFGESVLSVTVFLSNMHFLQSTNYFAEAASMQPLLHTWSLAVEEQFYLFYPLVLWLLWRLARSALVPALVVMAVASFVISIWASHAMPVANFDLLPTRVWELLAGALCVFATRKAGGGDHFRPHGNGGVGYDSRRNDRPRRNLGAAGVCDLDGRSGHSLRHRLCASRPGVGGAALDPAANRGGRLDQL